MKFAHARQKLVENLKNKGITNLSILNAFSEIPRHLFIEDALISRAYNDCPLPIGYSQTISQPYIVALMLEALDLKKEFRVLEIGAGTGYQTSLLAKLVAKVYAVERIAALTKQAQTHLDQLNLYNVYLKTFDGTLGWKDESPFDAMIVSAGSKEVPSPYLLQLKTGGKLIIPIGEEFSQQLTLVTKKNETNCTTQNLGDCRFVKLIGEHGWK